MGKEGVVEVVITVAFCLSTELVSQSAVIRSSVNLSANIRGNLQMRVGITAAFAQSLNCLTVL